MLEEHPDLWEYTHVQNCDGMLWTIPITNQCHILLNFQVVVFLCLHLDKLVTVQANRVHLEPLNRFSLYYFTILRMSIIDNCTFIPNKSGSEPLPTQKKASGPVPS